MKPNYWVYPGLTNIERIIAVNPKEIIRIACEAYDVNYEDVLSPMRTRNLVRCRQALMLVLNKLLNFETVKVAKLLNRDHSSVCHGRDTYADLITRNEDERHYFMRFISNLPEQVIERFENDYPMLSVVGVKLPDVNIKLPKKKLPADFGMKVFLGEYEKAK